VKLDLEVYIPKPSGFLLDVSFDCVTESIGIVGPSGSGKSTLLNAIAGIEPSRKLLIDGCDLSGVKLHCRRIGYVTQDALLFPHLSVHENLRYSPYADQLDDVVAVLGIEHLMDRMPRNLSGGERRRVALARAVASRPSMLLLDEPFTGMDEERRREAMSLLDKVHRTFQIPMVLVSHIAEEVIGLTTWTLRLESGKMTAFGPSASILRAGEIKIDNYMAGIVVGTNQVKVGNIELVTTLPPDTAGEVRLACYAHDILLANGMLHGISARNCFWTMVDSVVNVGETVIVTLQDPPLRVLVTPEAVASLGMKPGTKIVAIIKATSITYLGR
jgi:molybdate transport system ATP-binding protein